MQNSLFCLGLAVIMVNIVLVDLLLVFFSVTVTKTKAVLVTEFQLITNIHSIIKLSQKLSAIKKARFRKCKLLSNLKMWYHCEAKKKATPARLRI